MRQSAQNQNGNKRAEKLLRRAQKKKQKREKRERRIARELAKPTIPGESRVRIGNRVVRYLPRVLDLLQAPMRTRQRLRAPEGQVPVVPRGSAKVGDTIVFRGMDWQIDQLVPLDKTWEIAVGHPAEEETEPKAPEPYRGKFTFLKEVDGYRVVSETGHWRGDVQKVDREWFVTRAGAQERQGPFKTRREAADTLR